MNRKWALASSVCMVLLMLAIEYGLWSFQLLVLGSTESFENVVAITMTWLFGFATYAYYRHGFEKDVKGNWVERVTYDEHQM